MSTAALENHLTTCTECARWSNATTRLTRLARLGLARVPDLSATIMADAVLPARRVLRRRRWLRLALLLVALGQLGIALPSLAGDAVGMVMSQHAAHEAAAWNLAIAVAFLGAVLAPRRAAGLVPLLATFVVVLSALSAHDIAAGSASPGRVVTHAAAVLGLVVLLLLDRAERALPPGSFAAAVRDPVEDGRPLRGVA